VYKRKGKEQAMGRTNVVLDDRLVEDCQAVTGIKTPWR
jgi:hypothetical protein